MSSLQSPPLKQVAENSLLPQLSCNYDEKKSHIEYEMRRNNLDKQISIIRELMAQCDLREHLDSAIDIVSSILIFSKELKTVGPWNTEICSKYSQVLNEDFERLYTISLDNLLNANSRLNVKEMFETCMDKLHSKLTLKDYKRYPSLIDVYCLFIEQVKDSEIQLNPMKTLPISLLLIDDYIPLNKKKGLKCCKIILHCLTFDDFGNGNYYEVVYLSLRNTLKERDLEITKLVLENLLELIILIPNDFKFNKLEELLLKALDELHMETTLNRKSDLFLFLQKLIFFHGVNSVSHKKKFNALLIENIDLCMNESIRNAVFDKVMKCLEMWVQQCWCAWKYSSDHKLLSSLVKLLYTLNDNDAKNTERVQSLITTLIELCEQEEKAEIVMALQDTSQFKMNIFIERINSIVQHVTK